jgi:hypothetical protein
MRVAFSRTRYSGKQIFEFLVAESGIIGMPGSTFTQPSGAPYNPENRKFALLVVVASAFLVFASLLGCGISRELTAIVDELNAKGEYSQARAYVEEHAKDYGKRNRLLYQLDRGMLAFSAGEFSEAIQAFEEAERIMDELYTISLSQEATTFVINDNTAPYRGEDFESVMVNLFLALSYANLSQIEEALVEARKVDSKLTAINLQYSESQKNGYQEDPFARLLMGILYEMGRSSDDLNDAYISYNLALQGYESEYQRFGLAIPQVLVENALSTAEFMGEEEEKRLRERFPFKQYLPLVERKEKAEVFGLHLNGRAPVKEPDLVVLPMADGFFVKLAFPRYKSVPKTIVGARLYAKPLEEDTAFQANFSMAEPIGRIAVENLEDRRVRIAAKTLARVTAKYLAIKAAQQEVSEKHGGLAGLLTIITGNFLAFASEEPDLRSWRTLPEEILISKLTLPPGTYEFWADCFTASGGVVRRVEFGERELAPGEKIFLQLRTTE